MTKTIIVGGGMLGNELKKTFVNQGHDAIIKKNIKYDSKNIIPKKTTNVIITAQSSDYKNNQFTDDLLYVNTILPMQIIKESFEVSGTEATNVTYFKVDNEKMGSGYLWYLKGEADTYKRFMDYSEIMMVIGKPSKTL